MRQHCAAKPSTNTAANPSNVCSTTGAIGAAAIGCAAGRRVSVSLTPGTSDNRKLNDSAKVDR